MRLEKRYPEKVEAIVKGIADGCVQSGAALIGGETAEMPGLYSDEEYDLAGFAVGACEKANCNWRKSCRRRRTCWNCFKRYSFKWLLT